MGEMFQDAHGESIDTYVAVKQLGLGGKTFPKTVDFLVVGEKSAEGQQAEVAGGDAIVGTIGMNLLKLMDMELDMASRRVSFFSQDHCRGEVVYWAQSWAELPMTYRGMVTSVKVKLDGKSIKATLDTGSPTTAIDRDLAESLFDFSPTAPGVEHSGQSGSATGSLRDSYTKQFKTLDFGGVTVHNPKMEVVDFGEREIILGMNYLSQLRLYFAYGEKKLYITAADGSTN